MAEDFSDTLRVGELETLEMLKEFLSHFNAVKLDSSTGWDATKPVRRLWIWTGYNVACTALS